MPRKPSGWLLSRVEHERRESAAVSGYCSQGLPPCIEKSCCLREAVLPGQRWHLCSLFMQGGVNKIHHITDHLFRTSYLTDKIQRFPQLIYTHRQPHGEEKSTLIPQNVHIGAFSLEPITSTELSSRARIFPDNSSLCTRWCPHGCNDLR